MNEESRPSKSAMQGFREVQIQDQVSRISDADARRSLNALAVTSNFVGALIRHPGPMGDDAASVKAARAMVQAAESVTSSLISELSLDSVSWARFPLMRMASRAVADRWRASARDGQATADVSDLLPVWKELAKHDLPAQTYEPMPEDEHIALQIALLDAMAPVLREIAVFDMFHQQDAVAMTARDRILETTNTAMQSLLGEGAGENSRKQLRSSLLRNAGMLYASAWRRHAENLLEFLRSLSSAAQTAEVGRNPGGFPLEQVDQAFLESFAKLTDMVQYLAPPRVYRSNAAAEISDELNAVNVEKEAEKEAESDTNNEANSESRITGADESIALSNNIETEQDSSQSQETGSTGKDILDAASDAESREKNQDTSNSISDSEIDHAAQGVKVEADFYSRT